MTRPWLGFRQAVRARPWLKRQEPGPADPKRYLLALTAQANEPFFLTMPTRRLLGRQRQEAGLSSDVPGARVPQAAHRCQARTTWRDGSSDNFGRPRPHTP